MKKFLSAVLVFAVMLSALNISASAAVSNNIMKEFYVSTSGNDSANGSASAPFLTLERARNEVRKYNTNMSGDIVVYIADGRYEISDTVSFTKEDSGTNGYYVRYEAQSGAKPIISGGTLVKGTWTRESGKNIYSIPFERTEKLRALYVNGKRAYMTSKKLTAAGGYGTYSITKDQASWAWISGSADAGTKFKASDLPLTTRNQDDIELMTQTTWNTAIVCVEKLQDIGNSQVSATLQMPYGAIAQKPGWNNAYKRSGTQTVYNVFEWLDEPGEFYFDKAAKKLYYYPRTGEDMTKVSVVVPRVETLIRLGGVNKSTHIKNVSFDGITFSDTDWNLFEVDGSHGRATIQGAAVVTAFADSNWHKSIYRAYDVTPGAIEVTAADHINFYNNTIANIGNDALSLINDVNNIEVDGNVIYDVAGSGLVIGHPQHTYIGDKGSSKGSLSNKEKYAVDTENVCKDITFTNNYVYEPSRHFWGDPGLMVFFSENLTMRYNHLENTPYSGLSLGWGWWNMNGDSDSIVPGIPSTTTKNNTVENNTFINCMMTLGDGGALYTLADMPGTVMNNNYISGIGTVGGSQHLLRGVHPDEGTRHLYGIGNVIEKLQGDIAAIDCSYWGRKGYNTWDGNYTTTDRYKSNSSYDYELGTVITNKHVFKSGIWNKEVFDIITSSDVRSEYFKNMPSVFKLQDRLLPTKFFLTSESELDLKIAQSDVTGDIWLAPSGTTKFAAASDMTKAANGKIKTPAKSGTYKLYVVNGSTVSDASRGEVIVYDVIGESGVAEGGTYRVSEAKPITINVKKEYVKSITLNGEELDTSREITTAGTWTLSVTDLEQKIETVHFTTYVEDVDKVFPKSLTVTEGKVCINKDAANGAVAWFVPSGKTISGASELIESEEMTKAASADAKFILAPTKKGKYNLVLVSTASVSTLSQTTLTVTDGKLQVSDGLLLRLSADDIDLTNGSGVAQWKSADGKYTMVQSTASAQPTLSEGEYGMKSVTFDGSDDAMVLTSGQSIDLNGKSNLSMVTLSAYTGTDPKTTTYGDANCTFYIGESGSWGSIFVSSYAGFVVTRFGSGQSNNLINYARSEATNGFTVTAATKDGATEKVYDNGELVATAENKYTKTANNKTTLALGKIAAGQTSFFKGSISEILIYDRTLSGDEIKEIQGYMNMQLYLRGVNEHIQKAEDIILSSKDGTYVPQSMERLSDAQGVMLNMRGELLSGAKLSEEVVAANIAALEDAIKYFYDDSIAATDDTQSLTLPTFVTDTIELPSVGKAGSTITWTSDMPSVIAPNGTLTQPQIGKAAANVKLTATISYGSTTKNKSFEVRVLPKQSVEDIWTSAADYSYHTIDAQSSAQFSFDITPTCLSDGIVAFTGSGVTPSTWGNYSIVVRLRPDGTMDAVNGDGYAVTNAVQYTPNEMYHVRVLCNVADKKYSVYVSDMYGKCTALAENFAFRTSAPEISDISRITVRGGSGVAAGLFTVTSFRFAKNTSGEIINAAKGNGEILYCVQSDTDGDCLIFSIGYNADGSVGFSDMKTQTLKKGAGIDARINTSEPCSTYKIFMWSKGSLKPVAIPLSL